MLKYQRVDKDWKPLPIYEDHRFLRYYRYQGFYNKSENCTRGKNMVIVQEIQQQKNMSIVLNLMKDTTST